MIRTSEQINEIAKALAAAQASVMKAGKDGKNQHFRSKYATLESVWDACREPLTKNGLAVVQAPASDSGRVIVTTRFLHISGQWIESSLSLRPMKDDAQAIGSAITYGKRYGLMAMAGIADDDDDDGDKAVRPAAPPINMHDQINFTIPGHSYFFKKICDEFDPENQMGNTREIAKHALDNKMRFRDLQIFLAQQKHDV